MIFIICDQDFCKEKKIQDIDCSEPEVQELNREYDIIYAVGPQGEIFPVAILRKMCLSPEYISFDIGIEGCTDLCQVLVLVRRSVDTAQRIQ